MKKHTLDESPSLPLYARHVSRFQNRRVADFRRRAEVNERRVCPNLAPRWPRGAPKPRLLIPSSPIASAILFAVLIAGIWRLNLPVFRCAVCSIRDGSQRLRGAQRVVEADVAADKSSTAHSALSPADSRSLRRARPPDVSQTSYVDVDNISARSWR